MLSMLCFDASSILYSQVLNILFMLICSENFNFSRIYRLFKSENGEKMLNRFFYFNTVHTAVYEKNEEREINENLTENDAPATIRIRLPHGCITLVNLTERGRGQRQYERH